MYPETQRPALHSNGQCCCRTGDIAEASGDPPYYTLLGRASADIIKAAGYKISALRIENVIAAHPHVREVAVLGMPHDTLGEEITAVVACHEPHEVTPCQSHPGLNRHTWSICARQGVCNSHEACCRQKSLLDHDSSIMMCRG